jgi:hypothetical protein
MLNVWKYDHLCENLTFIGYLCEICLMCENMTICVKIWLSLDNCVKYAQCVKIWPFVWKFGFHLIFVSNHGCFLSVCSFWSLVFSFWWTLYWIQQLLNFWWKKGETRVVEARLPFTSYAKKEYLQIILQRILLVPTRSMTVGSHTRMYVCQWSLCRPGARSTAWSTSCVTFLKHLDCHGF